MYAASLGAEEEPPVKVVEIKTVGDYQIAVLSTTDSGALTQWLDANQYFFPTNKTGVLDSYIKRHWYFIAVKINLGWSPWGVFRTANQARQRRIEPAANRFRQRSLRLSPENFLGQ